ncbi:MAG: hypothetical protein HY458_02780 [Parcubacteria group bacterium]|nr:hypothetical protein [Parcubacteria group bacterium]
MKHYVCTGTCGGTAETPGTCQASDCNRYDQPLKECECQDGLHAQILENDANHQEGSRSTE